MIKKLINKLFSEKDIECAIDEDTIDCDKLEAPPFECGPSHFSHGISPYGDIPSENRYTGIPAPILTPVDDWFSSPYGCPTEKQKDYMEKEAEIKNKKQRIVSIGRMNLLTSTKRCMI